MTSKHLLIIWLALLPALLSGCARGDFDAYMLIVGVNYEHRF